jgi:predicted transcriptional regulator
MLEKIFKVKTSKILMAMLDKEGSKMCELSKFVDTTYSHTIKTVKIFEQIGLVTTKKEGRERKVFLTEDGRDIALHLKRLFRKLFRKIGEAGGNKV